MANPTMVAFVAVLALAAVCEPKGAVFAFENQSTEDVWLATKTQLGQPADNDLLWVAAPAGEVVVKSLDRAGPPCLSAGTILVARERDADAVIDQRDLEKHPWCSEGPWQWSGPGDYD